MSIPRACERSRSWATAGGKAIVRRSCPTVPSRAMVQPLGGAVGIAARGDREAIAGRADGDDAMGQRPTGHVRIGEGHDISPSQQRGTLAPHQQQVAGGDRRRHRRRALDQRLPAGAMAEQGERRPGDDRQQQADDSAATAEARRRADQLLAVHVEIEARGLALVAAGREPGRA